MGVSNVNMGVSDKNLVVYNENMGVSNENMGVFDKNLEVFNENMGSPMNIWGSMGVSLLKT